MLELRAGHLSRELGWRERVLVVQPGRLGGEMSAEIGTSILMEAEALINGQRR